MIKFDFKIEDENWSINVFPQEEYDITIGCDSEAAVDVNQRKAAFCMERITREVIEHEITHIYFNKCCLSSVEMFTVEQIEEIVAEFVPKYGRKIFQVSLELKKAIQKKILEDG